MSKTTKIKNLKANNTLTKLFTKLWHTVVGGFCSKKKIKGDVINKDPSTSASTPSTSDPTTTPEHPIIPSYRFFEVEDSPFSEDHATPWDVQEVLQKNKPMEEDSEGGQRRLPLEVGPSKIVEAGDSRDNHSMWFHRVEPKDRFQWSGRLEYTADLVDYEFEGIGGPWTEVEEYKMRRVENLAQLEAKREKEMKEKLTRQLKTMKMV
ncbi:unnamed protein product [Caenorhabditis nigoni]